MKQETNAATPLETPARNIDSETPDAAAAAPEGDTAGEPSAEDSEQSEEVAQKPTIVQELEAKLAEKDNRLQATLVQYKEALDEFENAKARLRRDITKEIDAGKKSFLADLLEVVDNLERAIETSKGETAPSALLSGVSMVRDLFLAKLQNMGVRRIDALGQPFNPLHFEAISMVPVTDPAQDGMVVGVVRTCYVIGDETLRHGMVAVGKKADA